MKFKPQFVELVKEVGSFSIDQFVSQLDRFCDEHVPLKPNSPKVDISLLRFICNVIENSYVKKEVIDAKISKKKLAVDEYCRMKERMGVPLSAEERAEIENLVEDLHSTNQIKKISTMKFILKKLKKILLN
jgi:hypothetical protein